MVFTFLLQNLQYVVLKFQPDIAEAVLFLLNSGYAFF